MAYRTFMVPRHIFSGPGALESLDTVEAKKVLIVSDPVMRELGVIDRVEKMLLNRNIETQVFDKVEAEPSKKTAWAAFAAAQEFQPDTFIGLGGGSAMDAGKVAWVLYEHPEIADLPFTDFMREFSKQELRKKAKYIAITTSSGTGSEVTSSAVITDRDVNPPFKAGLGSPQIIPDVAIVDAELTVSMPPDVTANTGFDALIHAIEYFILNRPSDLSDSMAIWAARLIFEWLPKAVANGTDMEARDKMHMASLQAGIAFCNGRLGLVHGPSHDIGAVFHIPHGRANAFMLVPAFAWGYAPRKERFARLATELGISGRGNRGKTENLFVKLNELKQSVGIPLAIKDAGIDSAKWEEGLGPIIDFYMNRLGNNMAALPEERQKLIGFPGSADKLRETYMHAWNGTREELK